MFEVTADNALDYLRRQGWLGAGPAQVEVLSGGVSNFVFRVTTPERRFVVKQSRPQLRTRDLWLSDLDRIWREQEVMQALHPHLPDVVPEVLFVDRPNYLYAMSHAPLEARVWKAELLAGQIDLAFGARVGSVLGRIHQLSAERRAEFAAFRDHHVYVQLRVDPFYVRVQERRPEVAAAIAPIIHDMLTIKEALCHGDYTPKNILAHGGGFTLVDYETAHRGDPTMDLGLFLTHLTLKAVRDRERRGDFIELMRAFWRAYRDEVTFQSHGDLEKRGVKHLGVCLLARIDGTSPVDYLSEEARDVVRRLARVILLDNIMRWEDVWRQLGS
jgi:aminoglycoside phosphotransferase (APT) family kinase protein